MGMDGMTRRRVKSNMERGVLKEKKKLALRNRCQSHVNVNVNANRFAFLATRPRLLYYLIARNSVIVNLNHVNINRTRVAPLMQSQYQSHRRGKLKVDEHSHILVFGFDGRFLLAVEYGN